MAQAGNSDTITLFLAGDVMTGRGIDQVLPHPGDPQIYESHVRSAINYVRLAEQANGPVPWPVPFEYVWGDALNELRRRHVDARLINLETAVTRSTAAELKGINYKMNPANIGVILAAGIDCCVLANNHVLDWGRSGLIETIETLEQAGLHIAGAGADAARAAAPAVLGGVHFRLFVFSLATGDAGIPNEWAAGHARPGVNLVPGLSARAADGIGETMRSVTRQQHIVLASIHWGGNWGYAIPDEQKAFARRLIDAGSADIVHGHSSHHAKGIEVYRGKLILYGCGDFLNDYEGISGYAEYRDDLTLMYFPAIHAGDGTLAGLEAVPLQIRNMRLNRASGADAQWLADTLSRESAVFGTRLQLGSDNVLRLQWSRI